jgi:hypothetical protein
MNTSDANTNMWYVTGYVIATLLIATIHTEYGVSPLSIAVRPHILNGVSPAISVLASNRTNMPGSALDSMPPLHVQPSAAQAFVRAVSTAATFAAFPV